MGYKYSIVGYISIYSNKDFSPLKNDVFIIIIISIFKEDNEFSMNASLPFGPPINTDIDYYQAYFIYLFLFFFLFFWLVMRC